VEDNLVLADQLQREAQLQDEALQITRRTLEITQDQYRAGTVSFLNVVIAQNAVFSSESNLLNVRNRQLAAVNLLLKNIAGRWEAA
jgi:outer membrane protein TolC